MSRLFEALQSIEKRQSGGSSDPAVPFSGTAQTAPVQSRSRPLLLYAGIILLITATAGIGVFIVNMLEETSQKQITVKDPAMPVAEETGIAGLPRPESVQHKTFDAVKSSRSGKYSGRKVQNPAELLSTLPKVPAKKIVTQKGLNKHDKDSEVHVPSKAANSRVQAVSRETVRPLPGLFTPETKRMLQQAEELRVHGRMKDAAEVYETLWRRTKNPLVANNLAACLMMSNNTKKARKVLEKALEQNPDDSDLRYNLQIIQKQSNDIK